MRARAAMPPTTPPAMAPVLEVLAAALSVEEGAPAEGAVVVGLPPTVGVWEALGPVVVGSAVPVEEVLEEFVTVVWLTVLPGLVALGAPVVLEVEVEMAVWRRQLGSRAVREGALPFPETTIVSHFSYFLRT